jgi:Domain of unknown function (DUF4279)
VRISQRVYFSIWSETLPAAEMTGYLGIEPDELGVRASRRSEPPIPVGHSWSLHCRERGLKLDEQIGKVLQRVEPIKQRLLDLAAGQDVDYRLIIVRYLDDDDGEEEEFLAAITKDGKLLEGVPGQHQLLGWVLTPDQMTLLASIRCPIVADEYG